MKKASLFFIVSLFSFLGGMAGQALLPAHADHGIGADVLRCKKLVVENEICVTNGPDGGRTTVVGGGIYVSHGKRCISIYDDGKHNAIGLYRDTSAGGGFDIALTASDKGGAVQIVGPDKKVRFLE